AEEQAYIQAAGLDPLLHEPRRSDQLVDSADQVNAPDAADSPAAPVMGDATASVTATPAHHSARQPRDGGGPFNGPPAAQAMPYRGAGTQENMDENRVKALIEAAAAKAQPQITVNIPPIEVPTPVVNIDKLDVGVQAPVVNIEAPPAAQ